MQQEPVSKTASNPKVMMGKPVVEETRFTAELILEKLSVEETVNDLLDAHRRLTEQSIRAALAFGQSLLRFVVRTQALDAAPLRLRH